MRLFSFRGVLVTSVLGLGLASCAWRSTPPVVLTAEESQLLVELTRDRFLRVVGRERETDGFVTLRTIQGRTTVAYRFMPADESGTELVIRRIDDRQHLPVAWSDEPDGAELSPRGARR